MHALETRPVENQPRVGQRTPFHPETHAGFSDFQIGNLPRDEDRASGTRWAPTGFTIQATDNKYVGGVLLDRFFHNPSVGYTFRMSDATVVEYQFQPQAAGEFPSN